MRSRTWKTAARGTRPRGACPVGGIHDRVGPTAGRGMCAVPRKRKCPEHCGSAMPWKPISNPSDRSVRLCQCFLGLNHIDACAAALPLPHFAGEGWGGGKPHTPSPEVSAFAKASADEAAEKSAVPEWRPHPTLPRKCGRGSERTTLVARDDRFHGIDTQLSRENISLN
jgi:hypothetical protein